MVADSWIQRALAFLTLAVGAFSQTADSARDSPPRRLIAVGIPLEGARTDDACLARPVHIAVSGDKVYVVDAQDCAVKIFSKAGRFLAAIGRKGSGPGELSFPSGVAVRGGRVYVADKFNFRIQVLDEWGNPLGGFPVPFAPDRILALGKDRLLVTSNPTARPGPEKMLHAYDEDGRLLWQRLEAVKSGDAVRDAFRNMILVASGAADDFYAVFRTDRNSVLHYGSGGDLLGSFPVDARYAFQTVGLSLQGSRKTIRGFCWAGAFDGDRLFLLAPEKVGGRDLGPGRELSVIDGRGRLESVIELPCRTARFDVDGGLVFAIDDEGGFRIYRIVR